MNEFIVTGKPTPTPQEQVMGVMGISLEALIAAIRDNRDGQYDHLFKPAEGNA